MKNLFKYIFALSTLIFTSCSYLDVIPDNIATLDYAFANATTAERYLLTCYAGMPVEGNLAQDPAFLASDEFYTRNFVLKDAQYGYLIGNYNLQRGKQNTNEPIVNMYEGRYNGKNLWQTIRKCLIFQNNIDKVSNLPELKKSQWIAESKCIMAYCYFTLLKMYGPVPIIDKEFPIDSDVQTVRVPRSTFDECVDFTSKLLDDALENLPKKTYNRQEELGRFNQCINLSLKAKLLVMAASPLFNGNSYLQDWKNIDGENLISEFQEDKWVKAKSTCKEAIQACENAGFRLYTYPFTENILTARFMDHTFRNLVTDREWGGSENSELIWGSVQTNTAELQGFSMPHLVESGFSISGNSTMYTCLNPTSKMLDLFYTSNGLPISEDPSWSDKQITKIRPVQDSSVMYTTVQGKIAYEEEFIADDDFSQVPELFYQREPRFYTSLGFNRCKWYGNGKAGDDFHVVKIYKGEFANMVASTGYWPATGLFARKLSNINTSISRTTFMATTYPFPIIRLADMYLLYSECVNEVEGPTPEAKKYLDKVRERAGLKSVDESWAKSNVPHKVETKEGLREIIHTERMIELAFEGKRFWDLRRWLKLETVGNKPLSGYNMKGENPEEYWRIIPFFTPKYTKKDYLWPLSEHMLIVNPNLVQTKGW